MVTSRTPESRVGCGSGSNRREPGADEQSTTSGPSTGPRTSTAILRPVETVSVRVGKGCVVCIMEEVLLHYGDTVMSPFLGRFP